MSVDTKFLMKIFSPRILGKAIATLDKSTAVIISACWLAAFVTLILAVIAVHSAVAAKRDAAAALVSEPVLPQITTSLMTQREVQLILDRLERQFPDIKFEVGSNEMIVVKSEDGSKFHQWIIALDYIDTMAPDFRWTLQDMCVGSCEGRDLMKAVVAGEKMAFSLPQK